MAYNLFATRENRFPGLQRTASCSALLCGAFGSSLEGESPIHSSGDADMNPFFVVCFGFALMAVGTQGSAQSETAKPSNVQRTDPAIVLPSREMQLTFRAAVGS